MPTITPIILAGGSGTRLWPLSREEFPKQLLRLTGANTLLQETVLRLDGLEKDALTVDPPIIVTNEEHRFLIREHLEAIDHAPQRIVLEPVGRNTAPALTVVALLLHNDDVDPVLLVMPADHVISDIDAFHHAVRAGAHLAEEGSIVTFGIVPTHPDEGYGYIQTGDALDVPGDGARASHVRAFVEKPDAATAAQYVSSGDYLWNSGMFMMRASLWLEAIGRFRPDILNACRIAVDAGRTDNHFFRLSVKDFEECPSESIDYAVMEPLTKGSSASKVSTPAAAIALNAGWSDIGSWRAVLDIQDKDDLGNTIQGDVFAHDTRDSLVVGHHRFVATLGLENIIVVETADAVLVADKNRTQDVRKIVDWLKQSGREEGKSHRRVYRPWGSYEQLESGENYQVKRLTIKPGAALSLQLHHKRAEHWVVVTGRAKITRNQDTLYMGANESVYIPIGTKHRLENPSEAPLEVIEVQSGAYLGEDDIVRFEDRYDRLDQT